MKRWRCDATVDGWKERKVEAYPSQLIKNVFVNAAFLEIDSRALDDICDDLRVDTADLSVRHLDGIVWWIDGEV